MTTTVSDISRKQGDDYPILVTINKSDGTPHDLTGATSIELGINLVTKENISPADADYKLSGTIVVAADGTVTFPVIAGVANLNLGSYYAEVQFIQSTFKRTTNTFRYQVLGQIITDYIP